MGDLQVNQLTLSNWKVFSDNSKLVFKYGEESNEIQSTDDYTLQFYNSIPSENIKSNYSIVFNKVFFHFESIIYNKENGRTIECQLPLNAASNAIGNAIIKNPFDNNFQSNMATVKIENNLLRVRSYLLDKKYAFLVHVTVDIVYDKA